jgi:pyruvate-formate lyase-activating enzyme
MATFDCATCHNPRLSKTNNHSGWYISIFQKNEKESS